MPHLHVRNLWLSVLLFGSAACASTTLPVPREAAANPDAASMPVASSTPALSSDFDPWAAEPEPTGPAHAGHQHD